MNTLTPKIGFSRVVKLESMTAALQMGAGMAPSMEACPLARRMWLKPGDADFALRGASIYALKPNAPVVALHWGKALVSYPFFGEVAEHIGRQLSLYGECTPGRIYCRMIEKYGENPYVKQCVIAVMKSMDDWLGYQGRGIPPNFRRKPDVLLDAKVDDTQLSAWLMEALLRFKGKPQTTQAIDHAHALFPFRFSQSPLYIASNMSLSGAKTEEDDGCFVVWRDGGGDDMIGLCDRLYSDKACFEN